MKYTAAFMLFVLVAAIECLPGGRHEIAPDDPDMNSSLKFVERQMDNMINSPIVHRVAKVNKAYVQVVSGMKYFVDFDFGETECKKSEHRPIESCQFAVLADDDDNRGPLVGGINKSPESHYEIFTPLLYQLEREMDSRMQSPYVHRINKVTDAHTQIVAGLRFYITFDFGQTSCLKNATELYIEQCNDVLKTHSCKADIWTQSWINKTELLNFNCPELEASTTAAPTA